MKLYIQHPEFKDNQVTYLRADYNSGVNSLSVKNTAGFATSKFGILGSPGFDQAEIARVNAVTPPNTLGLSVNTKFPHNADAKVIYLDWNQIKVFRSITGLGGAYTLVDTIDIMIDHDMTEWSDPTGSSTYYYKFAFFNSVTSETGDLTDPVAATGFVFYSLGTMTNRVLSVFGDPRAKFIQRDEVKDALNEFYEHCQRELSVATKRHGVMSQLYTTQANKSDYDLPTDFINEVAIKLSDDNGVTFRHSLVNKQADALRGSYGESYRHQYTIFGGKIWVDEPVPRNNTDIIKLLYIPSFTALNYSTDNIVAPFTNATNMFVKYGLAICYLKDKKMENYKDLRDESFELLKSFISYIKKLNNLHPEFQGGGYRG